MSIRLTRCYPVNVNDGGYRIETATSKPLEPGHCILLEVAGGAFYLDITPGFSMRDMVHLLELFAKGNLWGQQVRFRAVIASTTAGTTPIYGWPSSPGKPDRTATIQIVEASDARFMASPVEPVQFKLNFGADAIRRLGTVTPRLRYVYKTDAKGEKTGDGRYLTPAIGGRHYFVARWHCNRPFETSTMHRGFDCTTYILSAYNVADKYEFGDGFDVARCVGCQAWEPPPAQSAADTLAFFESNMRGHFVMWKPMKHVVMVLDGLVHEFNNINYSDGYVCTDIRTYLSKSKSEFCVLAAPGTVARQSLPSAIRGIRPADQSCIPSLMGPYSR